ncbi:SbcC/MukB-like Walker B domain-containing protein [Paracoccus sp. (in: a-proteobacteria)]|uniref:SbcC/MukB-like Walker B domain-containing protein n=1 Tax=Paracoccus sp. TaxID=267 RepID=UPI0028A8285D|nr:SbcC/MukB-like Walker B domain-containing protein [Paracoccus sp. (in: a-proteobacteria)]
MDGPPADLAAQLKDVASEAELKLRDQRALYVVRLHERGFESVEALEIGIAHAKLRLEEARGMQQATDATQAKAQAALAEGEQIEKAFAAAETALAALTELEEKAGDIDLLAKRVDTITNALQAHDLETAWHDAAQGNLDAEAALATAAGHLETATVARQGATRILETAKAGEERLRQVQADLTRLEEIEEKLGHAAELRTAFDRAKINEAAAQKTLTEADAAHKSLISRRDATDLALEQARSADTTRSHLSGTLAEVSRALSLAVVYTKAQAAITGAEARTEAALRDLVTKDEIAQAAEAALTEAEARLSRTQAIILAEKLAEDAPCPVCGATDHPAPAQGTPEQSGLTEAFRAAQTEARAAAEARVRAESDLENARTSCDEKKRALAEVERPAHPLSALEAEKARLEDAIAAIGPAQDLGALADQLAALKHAVSKTEALATAARTAAGTAATGLAAAAAKRDTVVGALPEMLRTPEAVAARRTDLQDEQSQLVTAQERAAEGDRAAAEALVRALAQHDAAKQNIARQAEREAKARSDFAARLVAVGLDDAGYASCKTHFQTLTDDRKTVADHHAARLAAQTTLHNARTDCAGHARPALNQLKEAQDQAAQSLRSANTALAEVATAAEDLEKFKASLADALARTEALEAETGPLRGLADLANGKNDFNMTLETFAIAAMFDQVLEAANMRLEPMTRGRYRLERGLEATGGRGKRGLEIDVFDVNTGKARPTSTLSGGETFISALALALGLADVVESLSGKVRMDTIFIDEGFGSLDTENGAGTLDQVLQVLADLTEGRRSVGLISHVGLVQEAIPQGFYVRSTPSGSWVEERRGLG